MIENTLYIYLANLGTVAADRVYPMRLPDGVTLPAITYQRSPGAHNQTHSGASGPESARFTIRTWGQTYDSAKALGNELKTGLHGSMAFAQSSFVITDFDLYDPDSYLWSVIIEVEVMG